MEDPQAHSAFDQHNHERRDCIDAPIIARPLHPIKRHLSPGLSDTHPELG